MDKGDFYNMGGLFLDALGLHNEGPGAAERRQYAGLQLDNLAAVLPDAQAWAVLGRGQDARLMLLADELLFALARNFDTSLLATDAWPIRLTHARYEREDETTRWTFSFRDRDDLIVEGKLTRQIRGEMVGDQSEMFARALATKTGWPVPQS